MLLRSTFSNEMMSSVFCACRESFSETYVANAILDYRNHAQGWRAQLAGHYYWMNAGAKNEKPEYDDFLWDALLSKDLPLGATMAEVYVKALNIFNSSQYFDFEYPNPDRWVEAGIVVRF